MNSRTINRLFSEIEKSQSELTEIFAGIDRTAMHNQQKVLEAMKYCRLSERHFAASTGYGYNDEGREVCEKIFSEVFRAEKALVRPQIVSGTHAISLCLFGILRPGDELLSVTGDPYDTVRSSISSKYAGSLSGSLDEFGISYRQIEMTEEGEIDIKKALSSITESTRAVYIQRSTGYARRKALTVSRIKQAAEALKSRSSRLAVFVDNCYGEFIEESEPLEAGADIIAGSLIKNPGGGIAPTGGYIAGKEEYMDKIAARLSAPGIAYEVGSNLGLIRTYLQGLFLAPSVTANALKGAVLTSHVLESRGYEVFPKAADERSDIIQAVVLGSRERASAYCKGIQNASPVDSYAVPEPQQMPGYEDEIIMAAGNFIQGSSIELSADGPMKEPYIVYQQGGLTFEHAKTGLLYALNELEQVSSDTPEVQ